MLKRTAFLVYGTVSYLIFLGTFLYAVGFIGGFGVPSRLDGPAQGSFAAALAVNAGLLTLFAVQHSLMARPWRGAAEPVPRDRVRVEFRRDVESCLGGRVDVRECVESCGGSGVAHRVKCSGG